MGFIALTMTTPIVPQNQIAASQTSNDQDDSQPEVVVSAFNAITTSAHINLNHDFQLNYILPDFSDGEEETTTTDHIIFPGSKVLQILFSRIISPNAP